MMDGLVQGLGGGDEPTAETKKVKKLEGLPMEKARKLSPFSVISFSTKIWINEKEMPVHTVSQCEEFLNSTWKSTLKRQMRNNGMCTSAPWEKWS